jgi:hypothetical protein
MRTLTAFRLIHAKGSRPSDYYLISWLPHARMLVFITEGSNEKAKSVHSPELVRSDSFVGCSCIVVSCRSLKASALPA